MKVAYGVTWREEGVPACSGKLELEAGRLRLHARDDESRVERELGFDEIRSVTVRPPEERPSVVFEATGGRTVTIESAVDRWIVSDLAAHLFDHFCTGLSPNERLLVELTLKPGAAARARELLRPGPPFDPAKTALARHDAFVLGDRVLFLFETQPSHERKETAAVDFWPATAAWRELIGDGIRRAERVYTWEREGAGSQPQPHVGLGL